MQVKIFFSNDYEWNGDDRRLIDGTVTEAARRAASLLLIRDTVYVTIEQLAAPVFNDDAFFVAGYAVAKDWVRLCVPPNHDKYSIAQATYHEMHHLARGHIFQRCEPEQLVEDILAEGLATAFEIEQLPDRIAPFMRYDSTVMPSWLEEMKPHAWSTSYERGRWFFGNDRPMHFGYKLGRYIADELTRRHPDRSLASLARTSTQEILRLAGIDLSAESELKE
jgi:uncharacterized protein YjaZ